MKNKGLTLAEIIISVVILSLVMLGLTNLFISGKRYILSARSRMTGGELGRVFLDPLQMHVRQDTWDNATSNSLSVGTFTSNQTVNNIAYSANYTISSANNMRKAKVNITWNEPAL